MVDADLKLSEINVYFYSISTNFGMNLIYAYKSLGQKEALRKWQKTKINACTFLLLCYNEKSF